jgi:hypothetical protein
MWGESWSVLSSISRSVGIAVWSALQANLEMAAFDETGYEDLSGDGGETIHTSFFSFNFFNQVY